MALVKCPECGTEISAYAKACPKCGFPISEKIKEDIVEKKTLNKENLIEKDATVKALPDEVIAEDSDDKSGSHKKILVAVIILVAVACGTILMILLNDSVKDGVYSVAREEIEFRGYGDSDSWEEDSTSMSVEISGLKQSNRQTGTIMLDRDGDIYTGTLTKAGSNYDAEYEITWDDDAPEATENPDGYSAGSINSEWSGIYVDSGEIRIEVLWTYSHLLYSSDVSQGIDRYYLGGKLR